MAAKRQKKGFVFRFELGIGGMLGLGVVCFCVFLWMFLLGVWSGQTILLPDAPDRGTEMLSKLASELWEKGRETGQSLSRLGEGLQKGVEASGDNAAPTIVPEPSAKREPSFFSLQVGSFRDKKKAHREVLGWQARGHDAFFLEPEEGSDTFRVFIGRFEKLGEANQLAATLEKEEEVRAYITLLPASEGEGGR